MADYGEIFCTAVNEIVKQQIGQINFDLTKECTVVSVQNKKNSEYLVSDGSNTFKAYAAAGASYNVGDQVLISIPEGDYNKQKTIVNKVVSDESSPIGYVSPLDDFIAGTGNIIQVAGPESIAANGSESLKLLFSLDDSQKNLYFGFTKIALTAEFMTLLDNLGIVTGEYGLKLLVTDAAGSATELTFSSSKMLGNPYMFNTYFHQECVFTIPDSIKDINSIKLYLYQDGNFTDGKKKLAYEDKVIDNIFVKNINVILGFSSNHATSEVVQITADNTSYQKDDNTRYPTLQWFHLVDTGVFEPINSNNWEKKKDFCEIRWYQYEPGCPEDDTDEYGDKNWRWLNQPENLAGVPGNYPFSYPITLSERKETEKIKVVTIYTEYPLQNNPTHEKKTNYTSNVLEFKNTTEETQGGTQTDEQVKEDLSLFFTDNSYGNYFWYDQNGVLIDAANQGSSKLRTVEIRAKGVTLNADWESYKAIDWIKWEIPANDDATMIMPGPSIKFSNPADNLLDELDTGIDHADTGDFNFTADVEGLATKKISKIKVILSMLVNSNWDAPQNRPITTVISTGGQDDKKISARFKINRAHDKIKINFEYYDKDNNKIKNDEADVSVSNIALKPKTVFLTVTKTKEDGISLYYSIKNNWTQSRDNNNIKCTVSVNGVPHILTETLRFGPKGSSGTANTFLLEMLEGKNALQIGIDNTLKVQAMLIGGNGKRINFTDNEKAKIEWTLIHGNDQHMVLTSSGDIATLTSKTTTLPSNNYAILQAKYKHSTADAESGTTPYLYAFLPIPMKTGNCTGMQGATQIIYNHQGVPKYSNQAYIAFNDEGQGLRAWHLQQDSTTNPNPVNLVSTSDALPSLALKASSLYSKNSDEDIIADKACVYCTGYKYECEATGEYSHHGEGWRCHLITIPENLTLDDNTVLRVRFKDAESSNEELWVQVKQGNNTSSYMALQYNSNQVTKENPYTWQDKDEIKLVYHSGSLGGYQGYFTISNNSSAALWSQPILIMQSQYDFAMLNSWDGSLTIDEENGIILATMLGAGKKDSQNRFSGVLIGDIKDGTGLNNTEKMTGVYGFDKGIMSYGLKENGSAFFGAAANGRIEINGEHGAIHSYGWEPKYEDDNGNKYVDADNNPYTVWSLNTDKAKKGSVFDLDDGQLQLQANDNNYFKYNANGSGRLEMALSGANITLNDKSNQGLSGYIDITASGLASEFRRTAVYAVTCSTEPTEDTKVLNLADFSKAAFNSSDAGDTSGKITDLTANDILQDGVTISVTFTNAENVTTVQIPIVQTVDGKEKEIGKREKRTGRALNLALQKGSSIIDNTTKSIYVNGNATNNTSSFTTDKNKLTETENNNIPNNNDSNPYGWDAGTTIYFTYKSGHWEVSDSGSYSRITQTADMIKTEVSNISGTLGSTITQTADKIRMEVAEKANYTATCGTTQGIATKDIVINNEADAVALSGVLNDTSRVVDCIILIKFAHANIVDNLTFVLQNVKKSDKITKYSFAVNGNPKWEIGETLPFRLYSPIPSVNGSRTGTLTMTSLSSSAITQLADRIHAGVLELNGTQSSGFGWELTSTGFALKSTIGNNSNQKTVLNCTNSAFTLDVDKLQIKSNPGTNENYLFVGDSSTYLKYTQAGNLEVKGEITATKLTIANDKIPDNIAKSSDIPTKTSQLTNDSGFKNETGVVTIINGTVNADYVNALGITANAITIKNENDTTIFNASGNAVTIAGWTVTSSTLNKNGVWIASSWNAGEKTTKAGLTSENWRFLIENNSTYTFGVTKEGYISFGAWKVSDTNYEFLESTYSGYYVRIGATGIKCRAPGTTADKYYMFNWHEIAVALGKSPA